MAGGVQIKKPAQVIAMRKAGLVVAEVLARMADEVRPGVTTGQLDSIARQMLAERGASSNFLNYGADWGYPPYPGVACISPNEVIVHGIPGDRELAEGDIVSFDFGAIIDGWHGDAARTFRVGAVSPEVDALVETTRESMWAGIGAMRLGGRVGDISHAIEQAIVARGDYGITREYTGHGIGTEMHMEPDVPNWYRPRPTARLRTGMVLAIEPMLTRGTHHTLELDDDWTVVSRDGSRGSHWENTVAITPGGVWVLTEADGGQSRLGDLFAPLAD